MKVVICDYEFPNTNPEKEALIAMPSLELSPAQCKSEDEVIQLVKNADGVLNQWSHLNANVIDCMENCQVIAIYGIGVDKIDVDAASSKGIYVCNVPDYNKQEVSNHAFSMLMALGRQLFESDSLIREGKYGFMYLNNKLRRFEEQTLGLVGFGRISQQLAYKAQSALEMNVLAYDPFVSKEEMAKNNVSRCELADVISNSDFISVHVPLTKDTHYLLDKDMLSKMKSTAYLINCGRGAVVNENALIELLQQKAIAGAAIDVFESEPLKPGHPLLELENVIVTPHIAWHTQEAMYEMQWGAAKQIALVLSGKEPTNAVNYYDAKKNRRQQKL